MPRTVEEEEDKQGLNESLVHRQAAMAMRHFQLPKSQSPVPTGSARMRELMEREERPVEIKISLTELAIVATRIGRAHV